MARNIFPFSEDDEKISLRPVGRVTDGGRLKFRNGFSERYESYGPEWYLGYIPPRRGIKNCSKTGGYLEGA
jgi:hypothetical protein